MSADRAILAQHRVKW